MSWLSKGLHSLEKNITRPVGKALKKVAPIALPLAGTLIPGVGNLVGGAIGAGLSKVGLGGAGASLASGGIGGALKSAGSFALDHPDLILGGLSAAEGMDASRKADRYQGKALASAEQLYNDAAPLRRAGLAGMLAKGPDYSSVFPGYPSAPAAQPFPRVGG